MRTVLVSAIALALSGVSMAGFAADLATTQLPREVRPSHYDVSIVPHAEKLGFDGKVSVAVEVLKPTTSITLNAMDMTFSSVSLTPAGKKALAAPKVAVDKEAQTATFTFAKPLPAGTYTLAMVYTGKIGTQANGLFAIDYDTKDGKKRALYTQFENSDARRFIPSWDEPAYKATFTLDVTIPTGEMAVSNMPTATTDKLGNGTTHVVFAPSPKMSTYLLFFGTGEFDRATTSVDGTEIGVIAQKGKASQANFALESSKAVLQEYNSYFGVKYPLPKLDNIASPGSSQFFSAMENWGAIFTFEYALLLDPTISTAADKQGVFSIAAHEMAHQWFGDLVTMRWWDDLWLNEGFASWMAARTTEKLHPEWNAQLSAVDVREGAMSRDAIVTTHPIVQRIDTVEQASQAFDTITYSKGEAVIRMLEGYVGADKWREGVQRYIKAHAYGNTVSDDLWKEMDAVAGPGVTTIAHDFTLQAGVPLISVEAGKCEGGNTAVTLTQGEFTKDRPGKTALRWHVPVIAQTIGGKTVTTLVDGKASVSLPGCGPVLVNAGQSGYYRTQYTQPQFTALRDAYAKLPAIDQMGLIGDAWALGMAGLEPTPNFLDLAKQVPVDAAPEMWGTVAGDLRSLDMYYRGDTARQATFRKYAISRLHPVFERIGWKAKASETASVAILRSELIGTLAQFGDKSVIDEARRRYAAQGTDPSAVPAELRKIITGVVASRADAAAWDKLHADAKAEKTPLIKDQLYTMLSIAEDDALAKKALDLALTDEPGATNSAGMIRSVSRNHPDMAFDFAVAHKAQVDKLVDSTSSSRYYPGLGGSSLDPAMIGKIEAFAKANIAEGSRRDAETSVANIKYRTMVVRERLPSVDAWLKAQK
ncbi:aminopeptidase N [Luteibacter rhizovicinus]|uniref:Aminopeptidase n=1 Tax=Luteibacter rhizovicinus TaxID=242606 RepID=A0A4R3YI11_9GAMM|nr:M1 family metallopeptidase [Luteibacter rhizovicinus]TCV91642.1 aminopeptidase N [Luteibacter rhizovicinus]